MKIWELPLPPDFLPKPYNPESVECSICGNLVYGFGRPNVHHHKCCPKKDCSCIWYDGSNGECTYAGRKVPISPSCEKELNFSKSKKEKKRKKK